MFEPAQLPQETICPFVAFGKGQIGSVFKLKKVGDNCKVARAWFEQKFASDAWNQAKSNCDPWIIALTWCVIGLVWGL